ncbi:MAG: GntP family permease, partial [Pirellulaceae bacterium]
VGFSVFPLALQLFRAANLPRRFIPAAIAFGSVTFTMTSAGSPEIQNLIPIQYLVDEATGQSLTDARAGWPVSLIVAACMFLLGQWYLEWAIRRDMVRGGRFESYERDQVRPEVRADQLPGFTRSVVPLCITLLALNVAPWAGHTLATWIELPANAPSALRTLHHVLGHFPEDATLAIFLGVVAAMLCLGPWLGGVWTSLGDGFVNGLLAAGSTSAVVGFGAAVRDLPSFEIVVSWVTQLPGDPLIGAAVAVGVIAAIAGSASGGQGIALPIVKPIFIDQLGVAPRALHRVVAIASGTLDSLPANGYLVMLIRNICGETHGRAYGPIFVTTVLIPLLGTMLAIALFKWFPAWGEL